MDDKTYNDALNELFVRVRQELVDEARERAHNIIGFDHTVARAVADMPEGARKKAVREILFVVKITLLLEEVREMGLCSPAEIEELKAHLMEWNEVISQSS